MVEYQRTLIQNKVEVNYRQADQLIEAIVAGQGVEAVGSDHQVVK